MDNIKFTLIYQTLFSAFQRLNDKDEKERQIAYLIFDAMNKMQEFWGDE